MFTLYLGGIGRTLPCLNQSAVGRELLLQRFHVSDLHAVGSGVVNPPDDKSQRADHEEVADEANDLGRGHAESSGTPGAQPSHPGQ